MELHNPHLHAVLAQARAEDPRRTASGWRRRHRRRRLAQLSTERAVTLRFGFPDDASALARLAILDSSAPPGEPVLIAEVDGELWAALSLVDGSVIADPFRPCAAVVELLRARAEQLAASETTRTRAWARLGRLAWR